LFNSFYAKHKIIGSEEELLQLRLLLVDSVRTIIDSGLNLLGIKAPEEM
jgi:arginyl-tRNA synthetase